jgi:hypothetical protein
MEALIRRTKRRPPGRPHEPMLESPDEMRSGSSGRSSSLSCGGQSKQQAQEYMVAASGGRAKAKQQERRRRAGGDAGVLARSGGLVLFIF